MNKQPFEQSGERDQRIAALLKAGLQSSALSEDAFTNRVMSRIQSLESPPAFAMPAFLWAMPLVLAAMIGLVVLIGVQNEEKTESTTIEDVLLADMPVETQTMLNRSSLFWNPAQGGFLP